MSTGIGVGVSSVFGGVKASPSFEYSGSAFCANATPDPTPTINGTTGGTFTSAPVAPSTGTLVINATTGTIDLSASDPGNYLVTYTVGGVSESDPFEVLPVQTTSFSYSSSSFQDTGTASPTITGSAGGVFTATTGLVIDNFTGVIDLGASTVGGPYTVTYTNTGACQGTPSTFDVSITATVRIIANNFALDFNGTDEYVSNPISYPLIPSFSSDDITISAWVNPSSWTFPNNYQYIFQDGASSNNRFVNLRLQNYAGINGVYFEVRNGSSGGSPSNCNVSKTGALNAGSWYHIVATYSPTDGAKIYVNNSTPTGGEVDTTPIQNGLDRSSHTAFALGAYVLSGSATSSYFNGSMDEVAVWNKAISANAVQEIYNATINNPGFTADLFKLANESQAPVYWNRMGDD